MTYTLFLTEDAKSDIQESYHWYERQRKGLGDDFFVSLNNTLEK